MSVRDLPTKNNLIKLQAFIKQSKQGHKLLEQKKLILTRELDKYKQKEKALKERGKNIVKEAENSLKLSNVLYTLITATANKNQNIHLVQCFFTSFIFSSYTSISNPTGQ